MTRLLLADVQPLDAPSTYSQWYGMVSGERRAKADSFRFSKDRSLSLGSAVLLDYGLRAFGFREMDMEYGRTANGKPFFRNAPDIHFNISHSSGKVAVAFSEREIGCDIEKVTDIDLSVAERFFSPEEYETVMAERGTAARSSAFFRYWTLKESYMKATGLGFSLAPESFTILPGGERGAAVTGGSCDRDYVFLSIQPFDDYECALCFRPGSGFPEVETIDLMQLP